MLLERTQSGVERTRADGKAPGRPASLRAAQQREMCDELAAGAGVSVMARKFGVSPQAVGRVHAAKL
ncbi:hypothetical protein BS642_01235 [Chromobacterium violaceum]|nr:hypothetical protein BS642_01235 [Chromobacterium violaceum]